jgi:hypothetical protein
MARIRRAVVAFAAFWWDFIVGDDWKIAAVVVVALALTATLARFQVPAWWLLPVAVLAVLSVSLLVALRRARLG